MARAQVLANECKSASNWEGIAMNNREVEFIHFGERPVLEREPYNASEVVALADSRFLFCDNNISDALYELRLTSDGQMASPLVRHPIGITAESVDDLEGMTLAEISGRRFIFAIPSLSLRPKKDAEHKKKKSKRGKEKPERNGLLRITIGSNDKLDVELIDDFRSWLIRNAPLLGKSPHYLPDDGGLNVEGLGWDPKNQDLLLGLRTPVKDGRPLIFRVHIKDSNGLWTLSNLQMIGHVTLAIENVGDEQGIRSLNYDPWRGGWLVVVGNATSESKAPFRLVFWDGNEQGTVHCFSDIWFEKKAKVEGVSVGFIDNHGAILFVDDRGGYATVWNDDPRLR